MAKKNVCNLDCEHCPHPDCIRPEEDVYKYPSWNPANRPPDYRQKQAERSKERYQERKDQGLCTSCGKSPAAPGIQKCEKCHAREMQGQRRRRKERKGGTPTSDDLVGMGLCRIHECGQPHAPGYTFCAAHLQMYRDSRAKATAASITKRAERRKEREEKQCKK